MLNWANGISSELSKQTPEWSTDGKGLNRDARVIDKALSQMMSRELVSSGEITDVLLDVRTLLTMPAHAAAAAQV